MALVEMVTVLKRELGLEGTVNEVIEAAAEEVGVEPKGPLLEVARSCMEVISGSWESVGHHASCEQRPYRPGQRRQGRGDGDGGGGR